MEAIKQEFQECLKLFPELECVKLLIEISDELAGAKATGYNKEQFVVLSVPVKFLNEPKLIRPILLHELCHCVDLENPDEIFMERADEKSKQLWLALQKAGALRCEVFQNAL